VASSSWHQHWGAVLVGTLIFFKESPKKDKKVDILLELTVILFRSYYIFAVEKNHDTVSHYSAG
jgi:hypothetical protein